MYSKFESFIRPGMHQKKVFEVDLDRNILLLYFINKNFLVAAVAIDDYMIMPN